MDDKYLDECERWANAEGLREDSIIFLQARMKRLIKALRKAKK